MSSQLTTTVQPAPVAFDFFNPVQFETMQRISKMFASSELVPKMYKVSEDNPLEKATANCMIAISLSQRMGADALMVMQNLVIIHGKPTFSSKFLIATVNSCGRYNTMKYKFTNLGKLGKVSYTAYDKQWIAVANGGKGYYKNTAKTEIFDGSNMDNWECIAYTSEKGSTDILESTPITLEMAVLEGWYSKDGSKWKTMMKQMLTYRAASFWTNAYAPDLSMGMKTTEEVQDVEDTDFVDITPTFSEKVKAEANQTTVNFDADGNTVDTETGEVNPSGDSDQVNPEPEKPDFD